MNEEEIQNGRRKRVSLNGLLAKMQELVDDFRLSEKDERRQENEARIKAELYHNSAVVVEAKIEKIKKEGLE